MTAPQREFTLARDLDAPRDLVYRVWTEPEHMSQWPLPRGVTTPQETISQDLRVGGFWRWTMISEQDGTRYPPSPDSARSSSPNGWCSPGATSRTKVR